MRLFALLTAFLAATTLGAAAQQMAPPTPADPSLPPPAPPILVPSDEAGPALRRTKQSDLDMWFERLAAAGDETDARLAEGHIQQIWLKSGSDTVDLLMNWAMQAMNDKDYPLALDLLDNVTVMRPNYVEGWNKRATVYYMIDDYGLALSDIRRALALEPRHFGALSGLGLIMRDLDRDQEALDVFRRALDIDPFLENIPDIVAELEKKLGGEI